MKDLQLSKFLETGTCLPSGVLDRQAFQSFWEDFCQEYLPAGSYEISWRELDDGDEYLVIFPKAGYREGHHNPIDNLLRILIPDYDYYPLISEFFTDRQTASRIYNEVLRTLGKGLVSLAFRGSLRGILDDLVFEHFGLYGLLHYGTSLDIDPESEKFEAELGLELYVELDRVFVPTEEQKSSLADRVRDFFLGLDGLFSPLLNGGLEIGKLSVKTRYFSEVS